MKSLKPSMREKKRYLLLKGKIDQVEKCILRGIGTIGMSKIGFGWIKSDKDSGIISINREGVDYVRACFAIWSQEINVEKVSGTLKSLRGK